MNRVTVEYTNVMSDAVGGENGLSESEFESGLAQFGYIPGEIQKKRGEGKADFMNLPFDTSGLDDIAKLAKGLRSRFSDFVVIGIGGSALGNRALHCALNHPFHNLLPPEKRGRLGRVFFAENIDPDVLTGLLDVIDLKNTVFNVITKSGTTAETAANFLYLCDTLKKCVGAKYKEHIVATTDPQKGALRELAQREGFLTLPIPQGVGGRYSVLSAVGLLSAAFSGINIEELLAGARDMDSRISNAPLAENPAFVLALIHYLLRSLKSKSIVVFMPYSNALVGVAEWFAQLWAESLGKKFSRDGKTVYAGQTPVRALGAIDQHSQIQLYTEGPNDKLIVFVQVKKFSGEVEIPPLFREIPAFSYLGNSSINRLLDAELRGTELALTQAQRPNVRIVMPEVSPHAMGQLLFMLEVQTAYAGLMFNVNAFDQPGVEAGKIASYALMGRPGFEQERDRIERTMRERRHRTV